MPNESGTDSAGGVRRTDLVGTARALPSGARRADAVDGAHVLEVSVYLKRDDAGVSFGEDDAPAERRRTLSAHRANQHADGIAVVERFARDHGLDVVGAEPARRLVRLRGTASGFAAAFGTTLHHCEGQARGGRAGARFIAHDGALSVPHDVAPFVESVLGLDTRPVATAKFVRPAASGTATPHLPNALGRLYDFPTGLDGSGQTIALIELGGGYNDADNTAAFRAMGLAVPSITSVSVDGATNAPGSDADGEVALDIQVAGGNAPGAKIVVYFAPNTDQGFADAISQAAQASSGGTTVMSISWGGPESSWSAQAVSTMSTQIEDAGTVGISVLVASGDNLATDGVSDGRAHVDFPASSPYAIGCGGTNITTSGNRVDAETVWNDGTSGTGGGISDLFPVPSFQSKVTLPPSANGSGTTGGRGVPDVAGDAAPATGYTIVLDGEPGAVGGTSAVAPLWASLTALLNQSHGRALGFFLPALYADPSGMREITTGDNRPTGSAIGYDAGPKWNACTGLGRPDGKSLLASLAGTDSDFA